MSNKYCPITNDILEDCQNNIIIMCGTDGSAINNGPKNLRVSGYGSAIIYNEAANSHTSENKKKHYIKIYGKVPNEDILGNGNICIPSNNRGELMAIYRTLIWINENIEFDNYLIIIIDCGIYLNIMKKLRVSSDSFINSKKNSDILFKIREELINYFIDNQHDPIFIKIKSHVSKKLIDKNCNSINKIAFMLNDKADELSNLGRNLNHYNEIIKTN